MTLLKFTACIACGCGFLRVAGVSGVLVLLGLAAIVCVAVFVSLIYVRVMSFLFDNIIGPFL